MSLDEKLSPKTDVASEPIELKNEVTSLLQAWASGDEKAQERLFNLVYPELKRLSNQRIRKEFSPPTIQPTELVSELYLRLAKQTEVDWQSRAHFFALAATMIRRILVDRARHRLRDKRGSGAVHLSIDSTPLGVPSVSSPSSYIEILALDSALAQLARVRATAARIVELRHFGGLNVDETAAVLGVGRATVIRRWRFARAWLSQHLESKA